MKETMKQKIGYFFDIKGSYTRIKENFENNPLVPLEVGGSVIVGGVLGVLNGLAGGAIIIGGEPNALLTEVTVKAIGAALLFAGSVISTLGVLIGAKALAGELYKKRYDSKK